MHNYMGVPFPSPENSLVEIFRELTLLLLGEEK